MDKDRKEVIKLGIFIVIAFIVLLWLVVLTLKTETYTTRYPKAKRVMQKTTPAGNKPVIKTYDIEEIRRKQMDKLRQEAASCGEKEKGKQGKSIPLKFNIHPSKEDIKKMESSHAVLY